MYKRLFSILVGIMLISVIFSLNAIADESIDFKVGVFGASLLTGFKQIGGVINNNNMDESVYNISYTFSVKGINDDSINFVYSDYIDKLDPSTAFLFTINFINGFGPVVISLNATTSNAGFDDESIKGFQVGPYTFAKPYLLAWF